MTTSGIGIRVPPDQLTEIETVFNGRHEAEERRIKREGTWYQVSGTPFSLGKMDLQRLLHLKGWGVVVFSNRVAKGAITWSVLSPPEVGPPPFEFFTYKVNQICISEQQERTQLSLIHI